MTGLVILTAVSFILWLSKAIMDATSMLLPMIQTDEDEQ